MKIGLLIYGSLNTLSGGYLYDRKLVEYLRAEGDTVEIISLPWRNYAAHLTDNLTFRLPLDLDILIQDELNHPSLVVPNFGKLPYPVISLVHHLRCSELRLKWQNDLYRIVEKKYLQSVDGFIFNSRTTKKVVAELIGDAKPSIVAYPPTDRFGLGMTEEEIKERANKKPFRILFLGNVIERKGLHTLLESLSGLQPSREAFNLDVIGSLTADPKYAQEMQDQVSTLGIHSSVVFHGALDNDPLKQMLRRAQVLIVPSSYEGYGIVYLEGMAFGLPAIGTTGGAATEVIADGETGYLIAPDNSKILAERILLLENDRSLLTKMSIHAVRRYTQQPRWEHTASQIREFLVKQLR